MNDQVSNTVKKWRQTPFGYDNGNDCILSLADYLIDCGYPDFASSIRGKYNNEKTAIELLQKSGGVQSAIDGTQLKETKQIKRGNIVLVKLRNNEIAGICTGNSVMFRNKRSVLNLDISLVEIVKMWSVRNA